MNYRFEKFRLDTHQRLVTYENAPLPISSKAYEILLCLIENAGKVVSKDALLTTIWEDSFVEEANLAVHISALRKVFKEKSSEKEFIKTVSGRGYVFTAAVHESANDSPESLLATAAFSQDAENFSRLQNPREAEINELFLKGRYILETLPSRFLQEQDLNQAIDFFEAAIRLKPNFVEAYIGICDAVISLNNLTYLSLKESYDKCRGLIRQAKTIVPRSSDIVLLEGKIAMLFELNGKTSRELVRQALELDAHNAEANYYMGIISLFLGDMENAERFYSRAALLSPLNTKFRQGIIRRYYFDEKYNEAIVLCKENIAMDSRLYSAFYILSACYAELGIYDEALKFIEQTEKYLDILEVEFKKVYIYALMNQPAPAEKLIAEVLKDERKLRDNLLSVVAVYAVQNRIDEAFDLLLRHYKESAPNMLSIKVDPRLKNLRQDERFQILLSELHLI